MKKIIISLILSASIASSAFASGTNPKLNQAIKQYKSKNYLGAMQSLEKITATDPGNSLAHYYLGMCYVQTGDVTKATSEYDTVITLSPNTELAQNANIGKSNLSGIRQQAIIPVVQSSKGFLSEEAKAKFQENNIKSIIDNVNNKRETSPDIYNRIENLEHKKSSNDEKPTQEQIAEAMQVLTKAGINTANTSANAQTPQINPEMMQMNMLMSAFGNNSNNMNGSNSMNNMMPMLMMMQNGQGNTKVDPETLQVMMSQMMMPNMTDLYSNNNNNNN
ncbi:MAG: tetratricopeptide repeat protein [bacterium]